MRIQPSFVLNDKAKKKSALYFMVQILVYVLHTKGVNCVRYAGSYFYFV